MQELKPGALEFLSKIQHKLKAPKDSFNAFGKYKYRSCESILTALKPLLAEECCAVRLSDEICEIGGRLYVKATAELITLDGSISATAFAREESEKKGMDSSQVTGSASSYARKYALSGLFGIDDNRESDATNDHGKGGESVQKFVEKAKVVKSESSDLEKNREYWQNYKVSAGAYKGLKFSEIKDNIYLKKIYNQTEDLVLRAYLDELTT